MKYVFSLDLKVDLFKMSNAPLVEDEIDDHRTGRNVLLKNERFLSGVNTPPTKVKETSIN